LGTDDIVALTTAQVRALTTDAIAALSTDQIVAMETQDLAALTTSQVVAMETADIVALHSAGHESAFTSAQVQVMSGDQLGAWLTSPIVLDLNGSGIQTVGADAGYTFDMTADGLKEHVGWIADNNGFLARDINSDGIINDGGELFGNATNLASGAKAKDGFEALRDLDANNDDVINSKDQAFNDLKVWVDSNHDGVSQSGEVHSLQSLDIAQLNLNAVNTAVNSNGNWIIQDATYTTIDGKTHQMSDVWFQNQGLDVSSLTPAQVAALTPEQVASLSSTEIASLSPDQVKALTTDDIAALQNLGKEDAFTAPQIQSMIKSHLASPVFDDVLLSGNIDVQIAAQAGSDHLQMILSGDTTASVELVGNHGDWKDVGITLVNGAEHHAYSNGTAEILVQGSVNTTIKDLLMG
jgi:hypothetical protein